MTQKYALVWFVLLAISFVFPVKQLSAQQRVAEARAPVRRSSMDISGHYNGYLSSGENMAQYPLEVTIEKKGMFYHGTAVLTMDHQTATFGIQVAGPSYDRTGNPTKISFIDKTITTNGRWCKKFFDGSEVQVWDDSLVVKGRWTNPGNAYFLDTKPVFNGSNNCQPGYFRIAKVADNSNVGNSRYTATAVKRSSTGCTSGDCVNGYGEQVTYDGLYKGQFKNGVREGQGEFTFTKGPQKGVQYVGHFTGNEFDGTGKIRFPQNVSGAAYYEGDFSNGYRQGNGRMVYRDSSTFTGLFSHNQPWGYGQKVRDGFTTIGYWENDAPSTYQGLP